MPAVEATAEPEPRQLARHAVVVQFRRPRRRRVVRRGDARAGVQRELGGERSEELEHREWLRLSEERGQARLLVAAHLATLRDDDNLVPHERVAEQLRDVVG